MIISELLRYLMLCISSLEAPLIIVLYAKIGNINVWFASEFLVNLYINMFIWRRLGGCLIRLGVQRGVARLASPYRL